MMNTRNKFLLSLFLITILCGLTFEPVKAQKAKFIADTITIKLQNGVVMKTLLNYNQKFGTFSAGKENDLNEQVISLLNKVEVLKIDETFMETPRKLLFSNDREQPFYDDKSCQALSITDNKPCTKLLHVIESDELFLEQAKHQAVIESYHYQTTFYFQTLPQLKEIGTYDLKSILAKTEKAIQVCEGGNNKPSRGIINVHAKHNSDDEVVIVSCKKPKTNSMLIINAGVGTEVIKQNWIGDVRLSLNFLYSKSQRKHATASLFSESKLMFSGDDRVVNHFLGLGYYRNISNDIDKSLWIGMNAGILINREGELFRKGTWFVGTPGYRNHGISLEPRLYFDGAFNNLTPSIRLGVTF